MRPYLLLLIFLIAPFSVGLTLKDYYLQQHAPSQPKKNLSTSISLPTHVRTTQFRPSPKLYRTTTELQNDIFRLVKQRIKYPIELVPAQDINWTREHRETIYHPLQKRTLRVSTLTDAQLKELLIRPDVRRDLGLNPLPIFKPSI